MTLPGLSFRLSQGCASARLHITLQNALCLKLIFSLALACATSSAFAEQFNKPDVLEFDTEVLKQRGLDPRLAEYFAQESRFQQGRHRVELVINGKRRNAIDMKFDEQGIACFDSEALTAARLKLPKGFSESGPCHDLIKAFPVATLKLRPGQNEIDLVVPSEALAIDNGVSEDFVRGGTAALLNYNLIYSNNQQRGDSNDFSTVDTELGFNTNDWLLRSRQTYVNQGGTKSFQHLYAYTQRSFPEAKATLQAGQISVANSLFGGQAILGSQWLPEASLLRAMGGDVQVEGIAPSNARVEVRQNNALIHSTLVPPGPFSLRDLPLLNGSSDLDVQVIGSDGNVQTFTVPAATLGNRAWHITPGPSFAAGKLIHYGDESSSDIFMATGTTSWKIAEGSQINSGLLLASNYQAFGWGLDHAFSQHTSIILRQLTAVAGEYQSRGLQNSASLSTQLNSNFGLSLVANGQTRGYRELGERPQRGSENLPADSRTRYSVSTSLNWLGGDLGIWRLGYSHSRPFNGQLNERFTAKWSKNFAKVSASISLEHTLNHKGEHGAGDAMYVSVNVPLGGRSLRSHASHSGNRSRMGVSSNERVNDYMGYRVQADRDVDRQRTDLNFSADLLPRYTQATLGIGNRGDESRSYNASLRGGIAAHADGITASPYSLGETFGIITVKDVSGVKVSTPQGPVWTDAAGRAIAPRLGDFQTNRLEIVTQSLPRNVDITNGFKEIKTGRGSVSRFDFNAVTTRRLLLNAIDAGGQTLEKGTSVTDENDNYITSVVGDGQIFLQNADLPTRIHSKTQNGTPCWLDFQLPSKPDLARHFESLNAVCQTFTGEAS